MPTRNANVRKAKRLEELRANKERLLNSASAQKKPLEEHQPAEQGDPAPAILWIIFGAGPAALVAIALQHTMQQGVPKIHSKSEKCAHQLKVVDPFVME